MATSAPGLALILMTLLATIDREWSKKKTVFVVFCMFIKMFSQIHIV